MKAQKQIEVHLIKKRNIKPIDVVQYDTGIQLVFTLIDFSIPSGTTATLYVQKKSGKFVYQETGITISGNVITVSLNNQALTEHGDTGYQVRLKNGADLITTFAGIMRVEKSLADAGAVESKTVISSFSELTAEKIAEIEAATDDFIAQAQAMVADKGVEVLATIPEDYTETYNLANAANREKADAIVCGAEGEVITVADSSDDHLRGLKVFGKTTQITTAGKNLAKQIEVGGNATINGNTITFGAQGDTYFFIKPCDIPDGTVVAVSFDAGAFSGTFTLAPYNELENAKAVIPNSRNVFTFAYRKNFFIQGHEAGKILIDDRERTVENVALSNIQLEIGNTASAYEPYTGGKPAPNPDYPQDLNSLGAGGEVAVSVCGKNLLNHVGASQTTKGVTFTNNGDGSFTVKGTSTGAVGFALTNLNQHPLHLHKGVTYTQSVEVLSGKKPTMAVVVPSAKDSKGNIYYNYLTDNQTKTAADDYSVYSYTLYMEGGVACDFTFRVQLEVGSKASPWETYKPKQIISLSTVNGLPGIPVSSGGNYTDANGQQWVCDEVDLKRGVYVQRFKRVAFTGQENWVQDSAYTCAYRVGAGHIAIGGLCTHYPTYLITENIGAVSGVYLAYTVNHIVTDTRFVNDLAGFKTFLAEEYASGHPVTVLRRLNEPTEIALTAAEIAAFKAIHSNKPNTTVFNDSGAYMALEYNADTKTYIDNKFAELAAAIVNNA